jgi:hypothetical protein
MKTFFIVLIVMNQAFALGYLRTIDPCLSLTEDCEDAYDTRLSTQISSWIFLYGDFSGIQIETPTQVVLFFFWTVMLPLLSMNLLIAFLSDTYERVYD